MYKPNDGIEKQCMFNQATNKTSWTITDKKVVDFIAKEGQFPPCVFPCSSDPPTKEATSIRTWTGDLGEARIATYTCLGKNCINNKLRIHLDVMY